MFYQDFIRIKAQFCNNISAAYMALKNYSCADIYNNKALVVDPDYFASYVRKCEIYEDLCEYKMCIDLAKWALKDWSKD